MKVLLKSGDILELEENSPAYEAAKKIGMGLYKSACAVRINGEAQDLRAELREDDKIEFLTFEDKGGRHAYNHTAAHVFAQAVKRLYPAAKLAIGPAVKDGFYYDVDVEKPFTSDELVKLESEMKKIIKENLPIERFELSERDALALMEEQGEIYKAELIKEHSGKGEKISFYKQGEFTDLCAGPHLMSTGALKAIKLTQATGAYWRGDARNAMLCRVYGLAFPKQSLLDEHLAMLEEAKKRDHRKLGKELELFAFMEAGPGLPFFLPKGMVLRNALLEFWRKKHVEAGYDEIATPIILNRTLWENSGHWEHYKDNMYTTTVEDQEFALKPMNCPGSLLIFNNKLRSYRDLPVRMAELGTVHRREASGTLHGLLRVRSFTQDDAHIYVTREQIKGEIKGVVNLIDEFYRTFGFEYHVELSTRPENSMGSDEDWEAATSGLRESLDELGLNYVTNEGDGAFYGPKIDFHIEDSLGRTWQCGTVQLDFQMPQRFGANYIGADGEKYRPVMLHRVVLGSIERFIGILTEHFAGAFPVWLAPVQVRVLPISEKFLDYARSVEEKLRAAGIRAETDERGEKIGYKIREAQMQKIPYFVLVGEKEQGEGNISVRRRNSQETAAYSVSEFIAQVREAVESRKISD
ncbi:MAG: threonine--tRNA ligase [Oscillospiraceae bacterium]|jgi:threonyl-tRNA synthetase|nr:threonine--tRNA ligase [Oscillospiraceae bacterium]